MIITFGHGTSGKYDPKTNTITGKQATHSSVEAHAEVLNTQCRAIARRAQKNNPLALDFEESLDLESLCPGCHVNEHSVKPLLELLYREQMPEMEVFDDIENLYFMCHKLEVTDDLLSKVGKCLHRRASCRY